MNHQETEQNPKELESYWAQDRGAVQKILEIGAEEYFNRLPENKTQSNELPCACVDERVGGFKLAIPGSGIMEDEDKAFSILEQAGITSISSHEDCGAAKLAFENLPQAEREAYGTADNYARNWTEKMAARLGIPYDGHEAVETPGLHVARSIYYDGSGQFQADRPGIPKGFTVSRKFTDGKDAQASLELCIKIALGEHGFGNKFNRENPLLIVPIGSEENLHQLQEEIAEIINRDGKYLETIKVDAGVVRQELEQEAAA